MPTDFAAALANPIAYQSQLEKHARQLAILEDFDCEVRIRNPNDNFTQGWNRTTEKRDCVEEA